MVFIWPPLVKTCETFHSFNGSRVLLLPTCRLRHGIRRSLLSCTAGRLSRRRFNITTYRCPSSHHPPRRHLNRCIQGYKRPNPLINLPSQCVAGASVPFSSHRGPRPTARSRRWKRTNLPKHPCGAAGGGGAARGFPRAKPCADAESSTRGPVWFGPADLLARLHLTRGPEISRADGLARGY